jgi:hypothetical protein
MMMKRRIKLLAAVVIVAMVLVADGTKSYFIARREVSHRPNLRCSRVLFVGVWFVSFTFDGAHPGSTATFTVAPLLPWIVGKQYCK